MATTKKMDQDMAFFGGKVPSKVTRKKMEGNDKEDGKRYGIFWEKSAINGDKKEDGWQRQRRWNKTWHFLGEKCHQR